MIEDIVVNLSIGNGGLTAADYAVSVASTLQAHITGIAMAFDPNISGSVIGYLPDDIIEAKRRDNEAAAQAAIASFAAATARAGVAAEPRMLRSTFDSAGNQFGRIARLFDLAIVDQAKTNGNVIETLIAESTLFESGRPVIVVPYVQRSPFKLDRVMVCWDGSRPAARAIADALPFLERAGHIEVVIVTRGAGKKDEIEGVDVGQHLARHGLKVGVTQVARGDLDIADVLLSHSVDYGADFIVMGGYGHSRLREFVLGGVTRSILQSMMVPTLMSH